MKDAAKALNFERAAELRDAILELKLEGWIVLKNQEIIIQGARAHNLKNISLKIPRSKLVVMTGLSGSGKSSLAFYTIYA